MRLTFILLLSAVALTTVAGRSTTTNNKTHLSAVQSPKRIQYKVELQQKHGAAHTPYFFHPANKKSGKSYSAKDGMDGKRILSNTAPKWKPNGKLAKQNNPEDKKPYKLNSGKIDKREKHVKPMQTIISPYSKTSTERRGNSIRAKYEKTQKQEKQARTVSPNLKTGNSSKPMSTQEKMSGNLRSGQFKTIQRVKPTNTTSFPYLETSPGQPGSLKSNIKQAQTTSNNTNTSSSNPWYKKLLNTASSKLFNQTKPKDSNSSANPWYKELLNTASSHLFNQKKPKDSNSSANSWYKGLLNTASSHLFNQKKPKDSNSSANPWYKGLLNTASSHLFNQKKPKDSDSPANSWCKELLNTASSHLFNQKKPKDSSSSANPWYKGLLNTASSHLFNQKKPENSNSSANPWYKDLLNTASSMCSTK